MVRLTQLHLSLREKLEFGEESYSMKERNYLHGCRLFSHCATTLLPQREALCAGFRVNSALLRHELAYVLAQTQSPAAVDTLIERLADKAEHIMVRHEAAEALGAIGERRARSVLESFLNDENPEVSESREVALKLLNLCDSDDEIEW